MALEGILVSAIIIQRIINDNGRSTRIERWLVPEAKNGDKTIETTPEQAALLQKLSPCFRERHVESGAPGELLSADIFFVSSRKGVGNVYLHAVVDTFGSYAFGLPHVSEQPEAAAVLHNEALPFYCRLDLPVGALLTDNGREFYGTENYPNELYLDLNGFEHRRTKVRTPKTNGFVERFNGTVLDEFSGSSCAKTSTTASRRCRPISTPSWSITIRSARSSDTAIWANGLSKQSCHSLAMRVKWKHGCRPPPDIPCSLGH